MRCLTNCSISSADGRAIRYRCGFQNTIYEVLKCRSGWTEAPRCTFNLFVFLLRLLLILLIMQIYQKPGLKFISSSSAIQFFSKFNLIFVCDVQSFICLCYILLQRNRVGFYLDRQMRNSRYIWQHLSRGACENKSF